MNTPTIVSAALSDKELQDSINRMVANFDKGLQDMLDHTNKKVKEINEALKGIGNVNFGAKGSNDGGVVKQTKAQNDFTDAVKKSTSEIKNQGKQGEMSFDQIQGALQMAMREVRKWESHKTFSTQDLDKYQASLARVVELNEKLKRAKGSETYTRFDELSKRTAFDANATIRDLTAVDDRLKQLSKYYKEEEKQAQKATAAIKESTQAKKENASVGQTSRPARDSYIAFMQGYKQQAEQIRRLMEEEQKAMQQRRQGAVDGFSKTIEERKARVKELSEEIAKLYKERPDGYRDAIQQRRDEMNALKQKIRELADAQKNLADSPIGASSRFLELEKEYNRIKNIMIDTTNAQRQSTQETEKQAQAQKQVTQGAKEYSEQVQKIAAEVRASAKWQQTDKLGFRRGTANIDGRSMPVVENLQMGLVLEEQIEQAIQRVNAERQKGVTITQQQSEAERKAAELLGWTETQQKKRYVAPITNIEQISAVRGALEAITGQQEKWVDEINKTKASYNELSRYVKELKGVYLDMERGGNTNAAKALAQEIQTTERAMQKFVQTMSRPVSLKAAMGLDEKTLDDIAYKMQRLRSYKQGIDLTKPNAANEIKQVDEALAKLQKDADKWMSKSQQMIKSNTALGRSWNYMKNRLAFYFTVGASTSFVKQLIDIRGQYELLERSIGILIDSAQNGSQIFAELNAMAIKSPYTTMELGAAAKQLVAYDVAAKDVVETTKRIGDMAAAVGIPIERLTYALGQIKAYGYLNARDARMFANAGIPLVKELADYYTELEGRLVSTADIYDRIKKKAIDYSDVMNVVNKMTDEGGKFFNFQEKAADTLKVRIANLTLAWNNMLNEMGKDNQGILTEGLKVTKQIFESWRDINNMVVALGLTYGTIKAAQIAYYLWVMRTEKAVGAWSKIINAIDYAFNAKIANVINSLKTSLFGFFTNPAAMLAVAFTALSVALTKAYLDYRDLQAANEEFNKSIIKNAEENVKSIDKFFGDYKKQLESVGSLNSADQTKLWERVQEEIEKTTKNAEKYIEILNKIPEVSKRIEVGESVLEQSKRIQDELKYMAERGMFNIGGGFANDSAAKDLQQYSDIVNELIGKYGTLDEAKKEALKVNEITLESGEVIKQYTGEYTEFQRAQIEAEKELQNIVSTLDKVNIAEILGSGDMDTQLANVRSFAIAWRDAFLATEKGSKISAEGQALLNSYIDKWIEQQARANHLIKDENTAAVEANRTAWETFFKFLNTEERKRLDVAIKTNQLGSKSVQELWDNAAERMQEKATTSYNLIQQQIADLRNTPDIVINVVYRNNKEMLEKDQEEFEKKYIQPKDWSALSTDEYIKQEKANREKYGTLMRKQGEDAVEYEKRISDERKTNLELQKKNGDIIEENKNKTDAFSQAVTEQAKKEKQAADDRLKVIKEVEDAGGYDFSTKSENAAARKAQKQAESELAKALKDELSTIDKVRSIYKDLTKEGMSHANAVERATKGWDETVDAINRVLQKNGLQKLGLSKFAGIENPRELVNMLQSQLNTLLKRGAKPAEIKELQTKIQTLNVDAEKYDLTRITKGLNNELGKLKDEYELAVELDANPELGNLFTEMFNINTSDFPKTIDDYMQRVQQEFDKLRQKRGFAEPLEVFKADDAKWESWGRNMGLVVDVLDENGKVIDKNTDALDKITPKFKEAQGVAKKWATDVVNNTKKLEYELAELNDKIAIKEKEQVRLHEQIENEKNEITKHYLQLTYQSNEKSIDELRAQALSLMPEYARVFNSIAEYSAGVSRRLQRDLMRVFDEAKYDSANKKWTLTGSDGKNTILNDTQYRKEREKLTKEIRKSQAPFKKIKEAFKPSDKNGVVDYAKGIELVSAEIQKLGSVASEVGNLAQIFGADEQTVEIINDVAASLNGVATAGQGISQIASGDYIGGAASVLSGITSIIGAWADNNNKRIDAEIKDSERAVKSLELAYIDLEHAINNAYGMATIGAQKTAIANKELQLAELKRQLTLEQSRDSKDKDEERIIELQKQIKELQYDIKDATDAIVNDLLGISSVGDAMESMMDAFVEALRNGEDAMATFDESVDEMIANMVKKMFTTKILQPWFEEQWNKIQDQINERAGEIPDKLDKVQSKVSEAKMADLNNNDSLVEALKVLGMDDEQIRLLNWFNEFGEFDHGFGRNARLRAAYEKLLKEAEQKEAEIQKELATATMPTTDDIRQYAELLRSGQPIVEENMQEVANFLRELGLMKDDASKNLSNLQAGISGITEETAGALEAITNGISQQCYLQSDLLTQIRDTILGFDLDIQMGVLSNILLQLQSSYQIQMSIRDTLQGWSNASGMAVRVEMI